MVDSDPILGVLIAFEKYPMGACTRRRLAQLLVVSPVAALALLSCTQQEREEMLKHVQETVVAAAQQTAIAAALTAQAQIVTTLPKLPDLPTQNWTFTDLPAGIGHWHGGFGANNFAKENWEDNYTQTAGLHGGVDFGNKNGTLIYSRVQGTVVDEYPGDAKKNVVVKVGDHAVIYGHIDRDTAIKTGTVVAPDTLLGTISWQNRNNHHLHLAIRIGARVYNPLYFFKRSLVETIDWGKYVPNEDCWSMKSFVYVATTVANYWTNPTDPKLGIER